jgi:roadblock/LC7 domain-containing protein
MLGLGGARDIVLRKFRYLGPILEESKKSQSQGFWTNKIWIPCIGWFVVGGLFNNCCVHPFLTIGEVEWSWLLTTLSILLSISGIREYGIYEKDREIMEKNGGAEMPESHDIVSM